VAAELLNSGKSDAPVTLGWHGREIYLNLPAISISTVTWNSSEK
jgi:hypothetical protein